MPLQDFDATKVQPQQPGGMGGHPPGIWDAQISNTGLKPSKNNQHLLLVIEFTTPAGRIEENLIVDGPSTQAIEIAQKQISALCHAVNIYRLTYPKHPDGNPIMDQPARELRGALLKIEIAPQKDKEGKESGYMEIKKYFDKNGNEPGKSGSAPQPQPATAQQGGWGQTPAPAANPAPMQSQPGGGWGGNPAPQQPAANPAPGGGWQPGGAGNAGPAPWNK